MSLGSPPPFCNIFGNLSVLNCSLELSSLSNLIVVQIQLKTLVEADAVPLWSSALLPRPSSGGTNQQFLKPPTGSLKAEQLESDQQGIHGLFLLQRSYGLSSRLAVLSLEVLFLWNRDPHCFSQDGFPSLDLNIPFLTDSASPHS